MCSITPMNKLTKLEIVANEKQVDFVTGYLSIFVNFGWEEDSLFTGETRFTVYCANVEFIHNLSDKLNKLIPGLIWEIESVIEKDWVLAWREYFTPIECGSHFLVLPPWLEDDVALNGKTSIIIEPKSAFGTGHHNTTALCLRAISQLLELGRLKKDMNFLDLGTGSGILGIACTLMGLHGIGLDIDELAVDNAKENCVLNNIVNFDVFLGSVDLVQGKTFDLIVANIMADPLKDMAPLIYSKLKTGACLILSGILKIQADSVQEKYMELGLPMPRHKIDGDWAALVWE